MKNSSCRSPYSALSTAALIAALSTASSLLGGCGDDADEANDGDVEQGSGATTATPDSSTRKPSLPDFAMNFVVSCTDTIDVGCAEFLGEKADADKIEATAATSCDQAGEELKSEPCPSEKLVGTCLNWGQIGGVKRWHKSFYYEPMTEAKAKAICMGGTFVPAE